MATSKQIIDVCDDFLTAYQETRKQAKQMILKQFEQIQTENTLLKEGLKKFGSHSKECLDEKYPEAWHCICGFRECQKAIKDL